MCLTNTGYTSFVYLFIDVVYGSEAERFRPRDSPLFKYEIGWKWNSVDGDVNRKFKFWHNFLLLKSW